METIKDNRKRYPIACVTVLGVLVIGGVAVLVPGAVVGGLGVRGFSSVGPVAGARNYVCW